MTILFPTSNSKLNPACTHIVTEVSTLYKVGGGRDGRYIFQRKCCFQSKRHPKITGLDLQHCPKNKLFDKQIQQFLSEERLRLNLRLLKLTDLLHHSVTFGKSHERSDKKCASVVVLLANTKATGTLHLKELTKLNRSTYRILRLLCKQKRS